MKRIILLLSILLSGIFSFANGRNTIPTPAEDDFYSSMYRATHEEPKLDKLAPPPTSIILPVSGTGIYITNASVYNSYDTLVVDSSLRPGGVYSALYLNNLHGTPTHTIYIVNKGKVRFESNATTFALSNCQYVVATSASVDQDTQDGFTCTSATARGGVGVQVDMRSKAVTFQYFYIYNKAYGSWVKNEIVCQGNAADSTLTDWVLDSIWAFHNRFNNTGVGCCGTGTGQAGYWGSTDPNGDDHRSYQCGTALIYAHNPRPLPSMLGHIRFMWNTVSGTGRGGFQLCDAIYGQSLIEYNTFDSCGFNGEAGQGNCVSIGTYSSVTVAHNTFGRSYEASVQMLGCNLDSVYDNISFSCGHLNGKSAVCPVYFIDNRRISRFPNDSTRIYLADNITGGKNGDSDIHVYDTYKQYYYTGNKICNNKKANGAASTLRIAPTFNYTTDCSVPVDTLPNTPTIIPSGGKVSGSVTITICCPATGVTTYYTTDGSNPKTSGTRIVYTVPFVISSSTATSIKVKAVAENSVGFSEKVSENYKFSGATTSIEIH